MNWCAVASQMRVGIYWHILPTYNQGRKIIWDGRTKEGRPFLDVFPKEIVASRHSTEMRMTLTNGSIYQVVGGDDVDRLVGTNPVGVILSEYPLHDPRVWPYLMPILSENDGWALFPYTPRGKNHGWKMKQIANSEKSWFYSELSVDDTRREDGSPVVPKERIEEDRRTGMTDEEINQEYYVSFESPITGAFYSKQIQAAWGDKKLNIPKRITEIPYESSLPVITGWDLGVDDHTVVWFAQVLRNEIRVVDYYQNSDEGLPFYVQMLKDRAAAYGITYAQHYAPHDIALREWTSGKSRLETARSLGINFTPIKKHSLEDGINHVRSMFNQCWFDWNRTEEGINALSCYRREFDEKNNTYKSTPLHDWASHPADAFRTLIWGIGKNLRVAEDRKLPKFAESDYDLFAV